MLLLACVTRNVHTAKPRYSATVHRNLWQNIASSKWRYTAVLYTWHEICVHWLSWRYFGVQFVCAKCSFSIGDMFDTSGSKDPDSAIQSQTKAALTKDDKKSGLRLTTPREDSEPTKKRSKRLALMSGSVLTWRGYFANDATYVTQWRNYREKIYYVLQAFYNDQPYAKECHEKTFTNGH